MNTNFYKSVRIPYLIMQKEAQSKGFYSNMYYYNSGGNDIFLNLLKRINRYFYAHNITNLWGEDGGI